MADFLPNLWESIFTAGPTPSLLAATNAAFGALQLLLAGLLLATHSIHFVVLSLLCGALWYSINWFAHELQQAEAKETEAERLRQKKREAGRTNTTAERDDHADDESDGTEVEGSKGGLLEESTASVSVAGKENPDAAIGQAGGQGGGASSGLAQTTDSTTARQRKEAAADRRAGHGSTGSDINTDSEWEQVNEGGKERD